MRQVPIIRTTEIPTYGLIGSGRMAKHLSHYFNLLNISHSSWSRSGPKDLSVATANCSHILLAISDDAIEAFVNSNEDALKDKVLIHFSGAVDVAGVHSAHPLMTFSNQLYDLKTYQDLFFICDNKTDFNLLFPSLKNKSLQINSDQKAFYHSLIVMAGNFPQILWAYVQKELSQKMDIPFEALKPYINQTSVNYLMSPKEALTGPLIRNDEETLQKHIKVLNKTAASQTYLAICDLYKGSLNESK